MLLTTALSVSHTVEALITVLLVKHSEPYDTDITVTMTTHKLNTLPLPSSIILRLFAGFKVLWKLLTGEHLYD